MSTTEQQSSLETDQEQEQAQAEAQTESATADAAPKSSTREYTLFEEARTDTWTKIGVAVSDTPEHAIDTLGDQKLAAAQKEQKRFMAVPSRFAAPKKPKVRTYTTIEYE